jgi:hypothetical protein
MQIFLSLVFRTKTCSHKLHLQAGKQPLIQSKNNKMIFSPFSLWAKAGALLTVSVMFGGSCRTAHAYDIGCVYPQEMPEPFTAHRQIPNFAPSFQIDKLETPIVVHRAHQATYCASNCVAYHDDTSLNVITKARPPFSTPPEYFNAWSRTLCLVQCTAMVYPVSAEIVLTAWNFEILPPSEELMDCNNEPSCLQAIVEKEDYDPRVIGQVVYFELASKLEDDGWNSLGRHTYDAESDSVVECTTNCAAYSDTTGYFPRNNPGKKTKKSAKKKTKWSYDEAEHEKYIVKDSDKLWQPLLETDDRGNFMRQDHVAPHIGYAAKPLLLSNFKKAKNPGYDYKAEANLVVKRLQELVGDEVRIEMLRFFDNKLLVRALVEFSLQINFASVLTFEDYMLFLSGISSSEHDAVLQAWREKVRFDRVRPTTVIQRWNNDVINTFNGDPSSTEPEDIKARDFQSFIRVMPHSEYPSGSASICTAYAEFTDLYTQEYFGETMDLFPIGGQRGFSVGCDGNNNPFRIGCDASFHVHNMTELASVCGESRLWGGMHFTKSVEAGNEIVAGIGELGMEFVKTIKAGSNWTNAYTLGSSRPVCAE